MAVLGGDDDDDSRVCDVMLASYKKTNMVQQKRECTMSSSSCGIQRKGQQTKTKKDTESWGIVL